MEVSHAPGIPASLDFVSNGRPAGTEADNMDIDMDIDLGPIDDKELFPSASEQSDLVPIDPKSALIAPAGASDATPHKLHIRGLDDLTTDHIKTFTSEHFSSDPPSRIEWIDDTSANIVFSTPAIALKALEQLTHPSCHGSLSELQLRPTKQFSAYPDSKLEIRSALVTDQKRPRAYEASRFYMMHPELDPREQHRKDKQQSERGSNYRIRRYGRDEHRRRRRNDREQGFEPTMYDDDAGILANRDRDSVSRRNSTSMYSNNSEVASSAGNRLRDRRGHSRADGRDRSASPNRDGEDRTDDVSRKRVRRRTPPYASNRNYQGGIQEENVGKELFPSKSALGTALNGASKELFPNKQLAANLKKELFPSKPKSSHHRRSDAFDAADETADLFARRLDFTNAGSATKDIKMVDSSYGRLNPDIDQHPAVLDSPLDDSLTIRGASQQQDQGFSIRGVAADGTRIGTIKELFPGRAGGNAGKELFAEKLQGRGGRRNKAADMFY